MARLEKRLGASLKEIRERFPETRPRDPTQFDFFRAHAPLVTAGGG